MMKIVVVSDSHGFNERLEEVLRLEPDADCYLHCGDIECSINEYPMYQTVQGNNDFYSDFPQQIIVPVQSHNIIAMHGNQFSYVNRINRMAAYAKKEHCDIFCYGRTHVAAIDHVDGVLLLNPGSLWRSRDRRGPSYAIITIEDEQVHAQIKFLD